LKDDKANRVRRFEVRLTEDEYKHLLLLEEQLGLSRTEIIRIRVLQDPGKILVNARQALSKLDLIGTELGRAGNNINQLARHANTLNRLGKLTPNVVRDFNRLFEQYYLIREQTETSLRQLIRLIRT
jgi:hypothetical protein